MQKLLPVEQIWKNTLSSIIPSPCLTSKAIIEAVEISEGLLDYATRMEHIILCYVCFAFFRQSQASKARFVAKRTSKRFPLAILFSPAGGAITSGILSFAFLHCTDGF
jgi:hypothetical protein